jgi:hypothetical protein
LRSEILDMGAGGFSKNDRWQWDAIRLVVASKGESETSQDSDCGDALISSHVCSRHREVEHIIDIE